MKALEFEGHVANKDQIQLPPDIAQQIPEGSSVRVLLLLDSDKDTDWQQISLERFASAYAEEDAIYEDLIHGPESR